MNYQNRYFILSNRVSVFCALAFSFANNLDFGLIIHDVILNFIQLFFIIRTNYKTIQMVTSAQQRKERANRVTSFLCFQLWNEEGQISEEKKI